MIRLPSRNFNELPRRRSPSDNRDARRSDAEMRRQQLSYSHVRLAFFGDRPHPRDARISIRPFQPVFERIRLRRYGHYAHNAKKPARCLTPRGKGEAPRTKCRVGETGDHPLSVRNGSGSSYKIPRHHCARNPSSASNARFFSAPRLYSPSRPSAQMTRWHGTPRS